jgi:NAD(P)H-flavin reductase
MQTLANGRSHIVYSKPDPEDKPGVDYDSIGHVDAQLLDRLDLTRDADFYLCGPPSFLKQLTQGLKTRGAASTNSRGAVWAGSFHYTRNCAIVPPAGSPSCRSTGDGTPDFICTKRAYASVGFTVRQFA